MLERIDHDGESVESVASEQERTEGSPRSDSRPQRLLLVVDFDGTVTEEETLSLLVAEFGDPGAQQLAESQLGSARSLHDVVQSGYSSLRVSPHEATRWLLGHVHFRPGVSRLVELAGRRGWRLVIVSSGLRELIMPLLERERLAGVELVANSLAGEDGWSMRFADEQPCLLCGEACKRQTVASLAGGETLVYVGDGYSDGCAALLAERVFARRRLAAYLEDRGRPFEPFEDFHEIADRLEAEFC